MCAVARRRGIAGFVLDGLIRDLGEVRAAGFPVYARGIVPVPGTKKGLGSLGAEVRCGGVSVRAGDIVVADEEGVVVTPAGRAAAVLRTAGERLAEEETQSLDDWEARHRAKVEAALKAVGYTD